MATAKAGRSDLKPLLYSERIPINRWRDVGSAAPTFAYGTFSAPAPKITCPTANNNSQVVDLQALITANPAKTTTDSADAGLETLQGKMTLVVPVRRTGTSAAGQSVSASAFATDHNGGAGSGNLVSSGSFDLGAQTLNAWVNASFDLDDLDPSVLQPGAELAIAVRATNNDTGGTGAGAIEIGTPRIDYYAHG